MNTVRVLSFWIVIFAWPTVGWSQIADSPRAMGMSGVRGDPVGSSAVIANPAGMSRAYVYAAEGQYFRSGDGDLNAVGLNIVDSKTQPQLAVGLNYAYQFADSDAEMAQDGHDLRLSLAHALVAEKFHLGVTMRYLAIDRAAPGKQLENLEGFTLDAGLLISLSPMVHLGLVGSSLIDMDDKKLPRRAGGGISYTGTPLVIDVDVLADFETHEDGPKVVVATGIELLIAESVPLRAGYEYDGARETSWVSGGLGFMTGQGTSGGQISVAYRHNVKESKHIGFGLAITMFL